MRERGGGWEDGGIDAPDPLHALGWSDEWGARAEAAIAELGRDDLHLGRVVRHDGAAVVVATADGVEQRPVLASVEPSPAVGDWVLASDDAVYATLPRTGLLRRRDPMRDVEQPLVANVDAVLIVAGLDRPIRPGRVVRATAQTRDAGATPIMVLTKADVADDPKAAAGTLEGANPGVELVITSATTGEGVDVLRRMCAHRTVVLIGESGAGKSHLTNALIDDEVAVVGAVRVGDAKGRHTTTARELHRLPDGGVLIDTPGIRSVGLWTDLDSVAEAFDDIETLALDCRFSDCGHTGEPGCAVAAAIDAGDLHPARLEAWQELMAEAAAAAEQAEAREKRANRRRRHVPHGTDDDPRRGRQGGPDAGTVPGA